MKKIIGVACLGIGLSSLVAQAADTTDNNAPPYYITTLVNNHVSVAVGPLVTDEAAYDASDVIYNLSVTNLDLQLLDLKKTLLMQLAQSDLTLNHPILQFSAGVGGELSSLPTFTTNAADGKPTAGVSLTGAQLDMNAIISPWASAFVAISGASGESFSLPGGFLTIGNLTASPIYLSLGQEAVPFTYSPSGLSTAALPASMMTITTPIVLLGYNHDNFMAAIYGYTGSDTNVGGDSPVKQGGIESYYGYHFGPDQNNAFKVGVGWVSNVADASGFQNTEYSTKDGQFGGFNESTSSNALAFPVSGADVNAKVRVERWKFIAEYVSSLCQFAQQDLSFDNHGAQPGAARIEVRYAPPFFPKKYSSFLGVAWDHTMQALALNFEQDKYTLYFNSAIWRETNIKLEYDRQEDYGASESASGLGANAPILGTGRGVNAVSLELWAYF